jgi:hypothetical protein
MGASSPGRGLHAPIVLPTSATTRPMDLGQWGGTRTLARAPRRAPTRPQASHWLSTLSRCRAQAPWPRPPLSHGRASPQLLMCSIPVPIKCTTMSASPHSIPRICSLPPNPSRSGRRHAAPPTSRELPWLGHLRPLPGQLSPPSSSPMHADPPASLPWLPSRRSAAAVEAVPRRVTAHEARRPWATSCRAATAFGCASTPRPSPALPHRRQPPHRTEDGRLA